MKTNNPSEFEIILGLLDAERIIKLYQEACDYYVNDREVYSMKELDEVLFGLYPSLLFKMANSSDKVFNCTDEYFMYNGFDEKLNSYSKEDLKNFLLSNYKNSFKDFYNNNREEFLKAILTTHRVCNIEMFNGIFSEATPLEIAEFCTTSDTFNYKDSYFIDTGEDLVSYKNEEALSVAILNKYRDCLEDFYYNDEDKFLKTINN